MIATAAENRILLCAQNELHLEKTFECGQCFRWNQMEDGSYVGVAMGRAIRVFCEDGNVYITGGPGDFEGIWRDYFDLDLDYESVRLSFCGEGYLGKCAENGAGIRILRQDRWEALCSFIISQCNNIPRIKKIVETLCECFGDELEFEGKRFYTFPDAGRIAALSVSDLAPLRCGYRAPYIINAAGKVASGDLDLELLAVSDSDFARKKLMELGGVGAKVANCTVLFGLHHMHAFPIDVWISRALKEHFPKDFDPSSLGPYAGLAQQYIFYYARSGGVKI